MRYLYLHQARLEGRLVVFMDGMDACGAQQHAIEPYVTTDLVRTVRVIATSRLDSTGFSKVAYKHAFEHVRLLPLTLQQQRHTVCRRLREGLVVAPQCAVVGSSAAAEAAVGEAYQSQLLLMERRKKEAVTRALEEERMREVAAQEERDRIAKIIAMNGGILPPELMPDANTNDGENSNRNRNTKSSTVNLMVLQEPAPPAPCIQPLTLKRLLLHELETLHTQKLNQMSAHPLLLSSMVAVARASNVSPASCGGGGFGDSGAAHAILVEEAREMDDEGVSPTHHRRNNNNNNNNNNHHHHRPTSAGSTHSIHSTNSDSNSTLVSGISDKALSRMRHAGPLMYSNNNNDSGRSSSALLGRCALLRMCITGIFGRADRVAHAHRSSMALHEDSTHEDSHTTRQIERLAETQGAIVASRKNFSCVRRFRSLLQKLAFAAHCARIRRFSASFVEEMIVREEEKAGNRTMINDHDDWVHRPGHQGGFNRRKSDTFSGAEVHNVHAESGTGAGGMGMAETDGMGMSGTFGSSGFVSKTGMMETWQELSRLSKSGDMPLLVWAPQKERAGAAVSHASAPWIQSNNNKSKSSSFKSTGYGSPPKTTTGTIGSDSDMGEQYCFCHLEVQRYLAAMEIMTILQRHSGISKQQRLLQTARDLSRAILPPNTGGVERMLLDRTTWWHGVIQLVCEQADRDGAFKSLVDIWLPTVSTSLTAPGVPLSAPAQEAPTLYGLDYTTPASVALANSNTGGYSGAGGTSLELGGSAALFAQAGGKGTRGKEGMEGDAQLVLLLGDAADEASTSNGDGGKGRGLGGTVTLAQGLSAASAAARTAPGASTTLAIVEPEVEDLPPVADHVMSGLRTLFMLPAFHSHCRNSLNLSGTQLMALPNEVGGLGGWDMRRVDLCNNRIASLPRSIHQLKRLTILLMHNNKLSTLPDEIGRLMHLHTLGLANNRLTALPSTIGRLRSLKRLDLEGNRLETLPIELGTGPVSFSLIELILSSNRLEEFPVELCRGRESDDAPVAVEDEEELAAKAAAEKAAEKTKKAAEKVEAAKAEAAAQANKKKKRFGFAPIIEVESTPTPSPPPTTTTTSASSAGKGKANVDGDAEDGSSSDTKGDGDRDGDVDPRSMAKLEVLMLSHNMLTAHGLPWQLLRLPALHTLLLHDNLLEDVPFLVRMGEYAGVEAQEEEDWDKPFEEAWDHLGMPIPPPLPAGPKPPLQVLDLSRNKLLWWAQDPSLVNIPPSDEEETANLQIAALCRMAPTLRHLDVAVNPEIMELHMLTLHRRLRLCEVTNTLEKAKTQAAVMASRFKLADGEWEDEVSEEERAAKAAKDARLRNK